MFLRKNSKKSFEESTKLIASDQIEIHDKMIIPIDLIDIKVVDFMVAGKVETKGVIVVEKENVELLSVDEEMKLETLESSIPGLKERIDAIQST